MPWVRFSYTDETTNRETWHTVYTTSSTHLAEILDRYHIRPDTIGKFFVNDKKETEPGQLIQQVRRAAANAAKFRMETEQRQQRESV